MCIIHFNSNSTIIRNSSGDRRTSVVSVGKESRDNNYSNNSKYCIKTNMFRTMCAPFMGLKLTCVCVCSRMFMYTDGIQGH